MRCRRSRSSGVSDSIAPLPPADASPVAAASTLAAATGEQSVGANGPSDSLTPEDRERRQRIWWYLLGLAAALLAVETVLSNRLSRAARPAA